jgi:Fe2+ or Zn2+ uptake regulation protein
LLETIAHEGGHLTIQDVFQRARERLPGLNLATVYRTVDSLRDAGLIDWYAPGSEPMQFALRDPDHPHGHLVCRQCGMVSHLDLDLIKGFKDDLKRAAGFHLDSNHLTLEGFCAQCAADDTSSSTN